MYALTRARTNSLRIRNATVRAMSRMAQLSTQLVADAWHSAWVFSKENVTTETKEKVAADSTAKTTSPSIALAAWKAAVAKAEEYDRREPSFHRTFLDIEMEKQTAESVRI